MSRGRLTPILHQIRRLLGSAEAAVQSDGGLLERFTAHGDEAAFTLLVQRHGPLVHDVCRRVLGNDADADDAFQAVFLVLARQAASIRKRDSVASWLFGVALRCARKAKTQAGRRRHHESQVPTMATTEPAAAESLEHLRPLLDEEMEHLPEKFRAPLVLCYLQGKTNEQAARELCCPAGSMSWRLVRGKELLRQRLERRGVALSAAALAVLLDSGAAPAALAAPLAAETVRAAIQFVQPDGLTGPAAELAEGVLAAMAKTYWKTVLFLSLLGAAATGAVAAAGWGLAVRRNPAVPVAAPAAPPMLDQHGDPLPPGAVGRLGTVRLRHHGNIHCVAYAPDGATLASSGEGGAVFLWDRATGRELRRIDTGAMLIPQVKFSPDGKILAATGHGGVGLYDVATGRSLRRLAAEAWVHAIHFSPDGKTLLGADLARTRQFRRWDVATGAEIASVACPQLEQYRFAIAPDGGSFVTWMPDKSIKLWDVPTGKELRELKGHVRQALCAAFSPDSKTVATGNSGPELDSVRLWDVASGRQVGAVPGQSYGTTAVAFSPDGKLIASLGWAPVAPDGREATILVHRIADEKEIARIRPPQYRTGTGMPANRLVFSPDSATLSIYGAGSAIRQWDVASGKQLHAAEGVEQIILRIMHTPDGRAVATQALAESAVRLWDPATGKELRSFAHPAGVIAFALSRDGRTLATSCEDHPHYLIRLWDVATGEQKRAIPGRKNRVEFLAFTPDDQRLLTWDQNGVSRIHDLAVDARSRDIPGTKGRITALAPNGRHALLQVTHEKGSFVWDVDQAQEVKMPAEFRDARTSTGVFAPDGRSLALYDLNRRLVLLHDAASGKVTRSFPAHYLWGQGLAFTPDSRTLAAVNREQTTVSLWDVATGQERGQFVGDQGQIHSVSISPDGRRLLAGGRNATVLIWDMTAAQSPKALPSLERPLPEQEKLWEQLAAELDSQASLAREPLEASHRQFVSFLAERLTPVGPPADRAIVAQHVTALDDNNFEVRQKAFDALAALGDSAEADLKKALEGKPSMELRQRIEMLLGMLKTHERQRKRELRAVEILEGTRTPESRALLQKLAKGRADAPLTQAAQATLARAWPAAD